MKSSEKKVSCIIPFFNEEKHISNVLTALGASASVNEIICVDDGSTDKSARLIKEKFPTVNLLRLNKNYGKTTAVKTGLREVANDYVLLLDADLKNLDSKEIDHAVNGLRSSRDEIDMVILRRQRAPWYLKAYRIDTLLSGERILKKQDLLRIIDHKVSGYQLEIAINVYMHQHNKVVYWSPSSATNTFKFEKFSPMTALAKELSMYGGLVKHAGIKKLIELYLSFGRKQLPVA